MSAEPHRAGVTTLRLVGLTVLALLAFAGNSLLCRIALRDGAIDPATFTAIRLVAGALTLVLLVLGRSGALPRAGDWRSACALFVYAAAFSFAYVRLGAATGALLLFGTVQVTMVGYALARGERLGARKLVGLAAALAGLVVLVLPGLAAPPLIGAVLMVAAGIGWGAYTLLGKHAGGDPIAVTAGNFVRAALPALALSAMLVGGFDADAHGIVLALLSGALTSGIGYVIWYAALPQLSVTAAAVAQLSVPLIAALGGVMLLDETLTLRFALATLATLGGIALVVLAPQPD